MYSRGNSYVQYLLLMITLHFTCHERKIWSIKKVSKYYEHDCSLNVVQNNCSKNIRQTPQKKSVVEPTFHKFTCWELWYFQNGYFSEILWETTFKLLSGFKKLSTKSSRPKVFCKKGILGNFAKFLRTPFILEYLWWLVLINLPFTRISLFLSLKCLKMFYKENYK